MAASIEAGSRYAFLSGGACGHSLAGWQDCQLPKIEEKFDGDDVVSKTDVQGCARSLQVPHSLPSFALNPQIPDDTAYWQYDNQSYQQVALDHDRNCTPYNMLAYDCDGSCPPNDTLVSVEMKECGEEDVEHEDYLGVISFIRAQMQKMREQVVARRDVEFIMQEILSIKEQEITQLKEELATLKETQHKGEVPIKIQFNICTQQDSEISIPQQVECSQEEQQQTRKNVQIDRDNQLLEENDVQEQQQSSSKNGDEMHTCYSLLDEDRSSETSGSASQSELELQVQQLMCEVYTKESEVFEAKNSACVLQQHVVSMSDKIMALNTQVQQLHTLLALQEDQQQATMDSLMAARRDLQQVDTQTAYAAHLVHKIGGQVGFNLPKTTSNLHALCTSLEAISQTLSTQPLPPARSTLPFSPLPTPKPHPCPEPSSNNLICGMKLMLAVNNLVHTARTYRLEQQVRQLKGRYVERAEYVDNEGNVCGRFWRRCVGWLRQVSGRNRNY